MPILLKKSAFTDDLIFSEALVRSSENYVGDYAINSLSNGRVSQPLYKAVGLTPRGFNVHRAKFSSTSVFEFFNNICHSRTSALVPLEPNSALPRRPSIACHIDPNRSG